MEKAFQHVIVNNEEFLDSDIEFFIKLASQIGGAQSAKQSHSDIKDILLKEVHKGISKAIAEKMNTIIIAIRQSHKRTPEKSHYLSAHDKALDKILLKVPVKEYLGLDKMPDTDGVWEWKSDPITGALNLVKAHPETNEVTTIIGEKVDELMRRHRPIQKNHITGNLELTIPAKSHNKKKTKRVKTPKKTIKKETTTRKKTTRKRGTRGSK